MKSNKGFSLVELIVVIAIMAIIAAVAIPVYSTYVTKAENSVTDQAINDAVYAAQLACVEYGCAATIEAANAGESFTITFGTAADDDTEAAATQVATVLGADAPSANVVTVDLKNDAYAAITVAIDANGKVTSDSRDA